MGVERVCSETEQVTREENDRELGAVDVVDLDFAVGWDHCPD